MPEDEMPPLPTVAAMPERPPEFSQDDEREMIIRQAASFVHEYKSERAAAQRRENNLQVQLTEAVLQSQSQQKKIDYLELENAEQCNNLTVLQCQVEDQRRVLSKLKEVLDAMNIKAPEKKPRAKKTSVTIEAATPASTND
jgi:uncharacterized coiled-coil protein SlyX